jgi:hypothetical protein
VLTTVAPSVNGGELETETPKFLHLREIALEKAGTLALSESVSGGVSRMLWRYGFHPAASTIKLEEAEFESMSILPTQVTDFEFSG